MDSPRRTSSPLDSGMIGAGAVDAGIERALRALGMLAGDLLPGARIQFHLDATTRESCGLPPLFGAGSPGAPSGPRASLDLPEGCYGDVLAVPPPSGELPHDVQGRLERLAAVASELVRLAIAHGEAGAREALFRLLADNSTDTIVRGDRTGLRLYISPAVHTLLGYTPEELIGTRAIEITHPDDVAEFRTLMRELLAGRIEHGVSEQRQRRRDGSWVWLEALVKLTRDANGEPDGYVASVRDISRRKAAELRLAHIASHDVLTDLPNRVLMYRRLEQEISRARRDGDGFAVLALDLDCFKQVNDGLGHEAGDAVLLAAADRFRSALRVADLVARTGGDEFVVVTGSGAGTEQMAGKLAARLIERMAEPIPLGDTEVSVHLSVGIALAPEAGLDAEGLLRAADAALYRAKQEGRGCWRLAETISSVAESGSYNGEGRRIPVFGNGAARED